jgi:hypothetical protein
MLVMNFVCGLDLESGSSLLIISTSRNACQGLIFSTYVSFWLLDVSKPLNSSQQLLQWMVARSHFKWEELRVAPRPPLDLFISREYWTSDEVIFSFHAGRSS